MGGEKSFPTCKGGREFISESVGIPGIVITLDSSLPGGSSNAYRWEPCNGLDDSLFHF